MEGGPEANSIKGGEVWMSGGGLAYDGSGSMYFVTGNGYASQLAATSQSVQGRYALTALEEVAVNAKINDDGTISVVDFFMPWEKTQPDGADKDLGTSPLELLPIDTFSCPNHKRIGWLLANLASSTIGSASSALPTPTGPTVPSRICSYVSLGCYSEKPGGRALSTPYYNDSMTLELCAAQAAAAGWIYWVQSTAASAGWAIRWPARAGMPRAPIAI